MKTNALEWREPWTERLERFFIIYLFANPVLDIINGIYIYTLRKLSIHPPGWLAALTPTLLLRIGVLVILCGYILLRRENRALFGMSLISLAAALSVLSEILFSERQNFFLDAQYAARFVYNIAALAVFTLMARDDRMGPEKILLLFRRVFTWTATIMSGSIFICLIVSSVRDERFGFATYGDRFGFRGVSGFYFATNEAVAIIMLMLPVLFVEFFRSGGFRDWKNWPKLIAPALTINAMLLMATKTAFAALIATLTFTVLYQLIRIIKTKDIRILLRFGQGIILTGAIFLLLSLFGMTDSVTGSIDGFTEHLTEEGNEFIYIQDEEQRRAVAEAPPWLRVFLSGREFHMMRAANQWAQNPYTVVFGVGRGSQARVIEMDFFEVLFYYGIFGFIVMFLPYAQRFIDFFRQRKKINNFQAWSVMLGLALTLGYSFLAGHVFFSVTGGFYFALMLVYGALTLSEEPV
jgi:hypothetical protein